MDHSIDKQELKRRTEIIAEYGGIIPYNEAFYIESIKYSATLSARAFDRFAAAVIQGRGDEIFIMLQDALTQAAALSRYFWPSREKGVHALRANRLRIAFEMDDQSPLKDRELRNALEHFDERLDNYLLEDRVGAIIPGPVVAPHYTVDEVLGSVFRLVDPWELVVVIFGNKHEFFPVKEEVDRILGLAEQFDKNGSRLPTGP